MPNELWAEATALGMNNKIEIAAGLERDGGMKLTIFHKFSSFIMSIRHIPVKMEGLKGRPRL